MMSRLKRCSKGDEMQIDYIVHESQMARMERIVKRLWILVIILIALLFGTNAGWLYYESQFTDEVITQDVLQEVSGENSRNYFNGGDYYGGTTESTDNNETSNP